MEKKVKSETESRSKTKLKRHISSNSSSSDNDMNDKQNHKQNQKQKSVHKIDYMSTTQVSPTSRRFFGQNRYNAIRDFKKSKKNSKIINFSVYPEADSEFLKVPMGITFMINFVPIVNHLPQIRDVIRDDHVNIPIYFEKRVFGFEFLTKKKKIQFLLLHKTAI